MSCRRLLLVRGLSTRASTVLNPLGFKSSSSETVVVNAVYDGQWRKGSGAITPSVCPTTGEVLALVNTADKSELDGVVERAREAYKVFRGMLCFGFF